MLSSFRFAYWSLVACGLVYVLGMLALTNVSLQRHVFYLHKVNPLRFPGPFREHQDGFEQYGFLNKQVTPFTLQTHDGVDIAAYHLLPLHLYHEFQSSLFMQSETVLEKYDGSNISTAIPVSFLLKNPNAKVILNFHGNAGHTFSAHRPFLYRSLLSQSTPEAPVHLFCFDYRGFGLSTGSPTEDGLITDGLSFVKLLTSPPFSISPDNIILVGQSLGTAVSTGTAHAWALNTTHPANPLSAGVEMTSLNLILMASFTNVPDLLQSYRIRGLTPPILSPLKPYPWIQHYLESAIVDTWNTSSRVEDLVSKHWPSGSLQLSIMHAKNDWDIPWFEGIGNWKAAMRGAGIPEPEQDDRVDIQRLGVDDGHVIKEWRSDGVGILETDRVKKTTKLVRWERALYGGHNQVGLQEWGRMGVKRVLERI